MKLDPTFSVGTLVEVIGICLTIILTGLAFYNGVTRHMTKTEEQILALLQRIEKLEEKQEIDSKSISRLEAGLEVIRSQIQFLYDMAKG